MHVGAEEGECDKVSAAGVTHGVGTGRRVMGNQEFISSRFATAYLVARVEPGT